MWSGEDEYFTKQKKTATFYLRLKARVCHVLWVKDGRESNNYSYW